MDANTVSITSNDSESLVMKINDGTHTATEVCEAFCERATVVQQVAIAQAKELDAYFQKHREIIDPPRGLPVSLKDQSHVDGVETCMGYAGWVGTHEGVRGSHRYKKVQSTLVDQLESLGAVVYCKTSTPQTLCVSEVHNNIIGYTLNPWNQSVSCGGSSGGEGALQALGGSTIGFGSDQGGPFRIPADFCGLYLLKLSFGRLPYGKVADTNAGQIAVRSVIGVIASSLSSISVMMSSLSSSKPWKHDPDVIELPWKAHENLIGDKENRSSQLCFGVIHHDGVVGPHPPVRRSVRLAVEAVKRAAHKVIAWNPPPHVKANSLHGQIVFSDKGADVARQINLSDEPLIHEVTRFISTDPDPALLLFEFQELVLQKSDYCKAYMDYWNSTASRTGTGRAVDGVLMPVAPHAGVITDHFIYYGYRNIGNLNIPVYPHHPEFGYYFKSL